MAEATADGHGHGTTRMPPRRARRSRKPIRSIRSSFTWWCGRGCSCSAPAPIWSTISACRAICRWSLILIFMMLKAGLIVAIFMHMAWERLALIYAIIVPPVLVLVFVAMMVFEADYTLFTRMTFFGAGPYRSGSFMLSRRPSDRRAACISHADSRPPSCSKELNVAGRLSACRPGLFRSPIFDHARLNELRLQAGAFFRADPASGSSGATVTAGAGSTTFL